MAAKKCTRSSAKSQAKLISAFKLAEKSVRRLLQAQFDCWHSAFLVGDVALALEHSEKHLAVSNVLHALETRAEPARVHQ